MLSLVVLDIDIAIGTKCSNCIIKKNNVHFNKKNKVVNINVHLKKRQYIIQPDKLNCNPMLLKK